MMDNNDNEYSGEETMARRVFSSLAAGLITNGIAFLSGAGVALFSAYWGSNFEFGRTRTLHEEHASVLQEIIRFEAAHNLTALKKSTANLQSAETTLEALLNGDVPAPPIGPGYTGLGKTGLRLHLESPNAYYIPHGLVAIFGLIFERLTRHEQIQRDLDQAVIHYAAARLTATDPRNEAADLLFNIRHQLEVSEVLVDGEGSLPVFLESLDQFAAGKEVCEYSLPTAAEEGENPQFP